MNDNELLQAILNKLDGLEKGQEALRQDVTGLKAGQESLRQDVTGLKTDVTDLKAGQETLQKDVSTLQAGQLKIQITLENDIGRKISALFDGHQLDTEKIDFIKETVEDIDARSDMTEVICHQNTKEINRLKAKMG